MIPSQRVSKKPRAVHNYNGLETVCRATLLALASANSTRAILARWPSVVFNEHVQGRHRALMTERQLLDRRGCYPRGTTQGRSFRSTTFIPRCCPHDTASLSVANNCVVTQLANDPYLFGFLMRIQSRWGLLRLVYTTVKVDPSVGD